MRVVALLGACAVACVAHEARPTLPAGAAPTATADPRVAVTEWAQVERYHCARETDGGVLRCDRDADCASGAVCDTSAGCGCCVPPPRALDASAGLHRYMFTECAQGTCIPPRFCVLEAGGETCTMRFDQEVPLWMTTWRPGAGGDVIAETRRAMCIRVEPKQDCLWELEVPGGAYDADAPMPRRYQGSYECGGRSCNGNDAVRASPRVGSSYTVRLRERRCGRGA